MNKEAMKENFQKAKTKVIDFSKMVIGKTNKFVKEHPYMAVGLAMVFASGITALAGDRDIRKLEESLPDHGLNITWNDFKSEEDREAAQTIWEENYKDKFNAVKNAFEEIGLNPGDNYIIANCDGHKFVYQSDSKNFSYKETID